MSPRFPFAALLAGLLSFAPAHAADPATQAMQAAYAPYRVVLFRTNSKAQAESEQAIAQALQAWGEITQQYAGAPPLPYAQDAHFGRTLTEVNTVLRQAEGEIRDKKLPQAHETLERVRDLLAELRQRNGVVVFSDHMNAYHEEMEHVLTEGPKLLAAPQGGMQLMARVGTLGYLAERMASQAPQALRGNAEFTAGQKAVAQSVAALRAALLAQDNGTIQAALATLKKPYSQFFLKFG